MSAFTRWKCTAMSVLVVSSTHRKKATFHEKVARFSNKVAVLAALRHS